MPAGSWNVLCFWRWNYPLMLTLLVNGYARGRESWIGKGPYRDDYECFQTLWLIVDRGAATGAKVKFDFRAFISHSNVLG